MITKIGPREREPYQRIIFQIFLFICTGYFIFMIFFPKANFLPSDWTPGTPFAKFGFILLLGSFTAIFFNQLLKLPFWLTIDDQLNELTVRFVLKPAFTFKVNDVVNYSNAIISVRTSSYAGIVIYLTDRKIMLSDINLDDFRTVERLLISLNVKNSGEKRYSMMWMLI